jgi:hypothetical protein
LSLTGIKEIRSVFIIQSLKWTIADKVHAQFKLPIATLF